MSQIEQIRPIIFSHPISNLAKLFFLSKINFLNINSKLLYFIKRKLLCHSDTFTSFLSCGYFSFLLSYLPENNWDWHGLIFKTTTKESFLKLIVKK
jgi:hypothetical protein